MSTKVHVPETERDSSKTPQPVEQPPAPRREARLSATSIMRAVAPPPDSRPRNDRLPNPEDTGAGGAASRARMSATLQRAIGNARIARLTHGTFSLQTKLTVNEPGDIYEREADSVADRVTQSGRSAPVQSISRLPSNGLPQPISRAVESDGESSPGLDAGMEGRIQSPTGGRPLAAPLRQEMEAGLGTDLSRVRVHDGSTDRQDADRLNAKAFAHDNHIWIGSQGSADDHRLMAHELTHVVQQAGTVQRMPAQTVEDDTETAALTDAPEPTPTQSPLSASPASPPVSAAPPPVDVPAAPKAEPPEISVSSTQSTGSASKLCQPPLLLPQILTSPQLSERTSKRPVSKLHNQSRTQRPIYKSRLLLKIPLGITEFHLRLRLRQLQLRTCPRSSGTTPTIADSSQASGAGSPPSSTHSAAGGTVWRKRHRRRSRPCAIKWMASSAP